MRLGGRGRWDWVGFWRPDWESSIIDFLKRHSYLALFLAWTWRFRLGNFIPIYGGRLLIGGPHSGGRAFGSRYLNVLFLSHLIIIFGVLLFMLQVLFFSLFVDTLDAIIAFVLFNRGTYTRRGVTLYSTVQLGAVRCSSVCFFQFHKRLWMVCVA